MAVVFEGTHRKDHQQVAVKIVTAQKARKERYRRAFRNEVQNVARLNHPHVVQVFDVGQLPEQFQRDTDGRLIAGSPYLVMEYVAGGTLSEYAPDLDWPGVKRFLTSILDALAHAHARRVIHRDLKPDNVLIDVDARGQWQPKLTDFGIARALDKETFEGKADVDEWITGTPKYMAPESIRGRWREQGPWTDLYGLGCIAWWLCAGQPPFWRGGTTRILQDHVYTPPPRLEPQIAVPPRFENWLWKMLAKSPEDRFQCAADAAYALLRLGEASPKAARGSGAARGRIEYADTEESADDTEVDLPAQRAAQRVGQTVVLPADTWNEERSEDGSTRAGKDDGGVFGARLPFFPTWRLERHAGDSGMRLNGAGLGLFGLRTIPMVDREPSRTLVWDTLRQVHADRISRLLMVRGPFGCGKSRLCQWMCQRAHELGCAEYFKATHSPNNGPLDGLGPMLARYFRCAGQPPEGIMGTVGRKLRQFDCSDQMAAYLARAIATVIVEASGADQEGWTGVDFSSPDERYAAVARLLGIVAADRTVIVWLDDAHASAEALAFAEHLLGHGEGDLPLLVLATVRSEQGASTIEQLERLSAHQRAQTIELGSLAADDHLQLVRTMLALDDELAGQVARRTEGNPLFAIQWVGDWVDRGLLTVGPDGFVLREGAQADVPDDIFEMWRRRLDGVLEHFEAAMRDTVRRALELAAVLGEDVSRQEWRNLCVLDGISPPETLVDRLTTLRLAQPAADGWSFAHGMLVESLLRWSREAGRWRDDQRLCVRMLEQTYPQGGRGIAERRAMHLMRAGDDAEALEPLRQAAREALRAGEYDRALRLLDEQEEAMGRLALSPEDRRAVENQALRARVIIERGSVDDAMGIVGWVEDVARAHGWAQILCDALLVRATGLRRRGELRQSLQVGREAGEVLGDDDAEALARVSASAGFTHTRLGEHDEALACFAEASRQARRAGDDRLRQRCLVNLIFINIQQGRWDEVRRTVEQTQALLEKTGTRAVEGHCWNALGEVARFHRQWPEARAHYRRAANIWGSIGHLNAHVARCNLAMVELADGRFAHARQALAQVRPAYEQNGYQVGLPLVDLGLVACAASAGDWADFDGHLADARRLLDATGRIDRELAWLADLAGDAANRADQAERADALYAIAAAQWADLGEADKVADIAAKRR